MDNSNYEIMKELISQRDRVVIEFGPGNSKKFVDAIAIDHIALPQVDIVADVQKGLEFIPDSSVDLIYSSHFMEHMDNLEETFKEFYRILKSGGEVVSVVPHFSNPYFYSDYTHKNFWGLYTPAYFSKTKYFKRNVPCFYNDINFEIKDLKLNFYSPFIGRKVIKKAFQVIFNSSKYMLELYEEMFSSFISAYEIEVTMVKGE
jgi:predicted SAM-dependent methyltransferase